MKILDQKLSRLKVNQEPLRLQIVDGRESHAGKCLCSADIVGFYGLLCIGGDTLDDPLVVFHKVCEGCIEAGQVNFAKMLDRLGDTWKKATERFFLLSKSVKTMPPEDWPVIKPVEQEGGGKVM